MDPNSSSTGICAVSWRSFRFYIQVFLKAGWNTVWDYILQMYVGYSEITLLEMQEPQMPGLLEIIMQSLLHQSNNNL